MLPKVEFISLRNMYRIASYRVISYVVISYCVTQLVFVSKNVIKVLSLCQQRRLLLFIISAVCVRACTRQPFACSHFSSVFSHKWPFVRKINNFSIHCVRDTCVERIILTTFARPRNIIHRLPFSLPASLEPYHLPRFTGNGRFAAKQENTCNAHTQDTRSRKDRNEYDKRERKKRVHTQISLAQGADRACV